MSKERTIQYGKAVHAVYGQGMPLDEAVPALVSAPLNPIEVLTIKKDVLYTKAINDTIDRMERIAPDRPPYGFVRCTNDGYTAHPGTTLDLERDFIPFSQIPELGDKDPSAVVPDNFYHHITLLSEGLKHTFYHAITEEFKSRNKALLGVRKVGRIFGDPAFQVYRGMGTAEKAFEYTLQMVFERFEFHMGRRPTFGEFRTHAQNSTGYLLSTMVNNMENVDAAFAFTNGIHEETGEQVIDIDQEREALRPIRPAYAKAVEAIKIDTVRPKIVCPAAYAVSPEVDASVTRLYNLLINALT